MATPKLDPKTIAEAHEAVAKHGSVSAAAKALGIARSTLEGRLKNKPPKVVPKSGSDKVGMSVDEIRRRFDPDVYVPAKIREGLKALGPRCLPDNEFSRLAGVSTAHLQTYRDSHEFPEHWHVVGGKRLWSGSRKSIEELRAI